MEFDTFDNLGFLPRTSMLIFCGMVCCYGFVTNNELMLFASKVGFPIAIVAGSMSYNFKKIFWILYYTVLLMLVSAIYFQFTRNTISPVIITRYVPNFTDFLLAVGMGAALMYFWNHPLKLNAIVMVAGLAFLLPAAVMAGYLFNQQELILGVSSLGLYFEYVFGIYLGSLIIQLLGKKI